MITILDAILVRTIKSSKGDIHDFISYVDENNSKINVNINSENYEDITQICIVLKNEVSYLYLQINYLRVCKKVPLSSIESISIQ